MYMSSKNSDNRSWSDRSSDNTPPIESTGKRHIRINSGKNTFRLDSGKYSRHDRRKDTKEFYNKSSKKTNKSSIEDKPEKFRGGPKLSIAEANAKFKSFKNTSRNTSHKSQTIEEEPIEKKSTSQSTVKQSLFGRLTHGLNSAYKGTRSIILGKRNRSGGIKHVNFNFKQNMKKSDSKSFRSSERKNQYFSSKSIAKAKRAKRMGMDEENSPDSPLPIGSDHADRILAGEEPLKLKRSETISNILKPPSKSEPKKSKSSFLGRIFKGTRNIITRRKSHKKTSK